MNKRKNYSTKHNDELISYLKEHKNEHLTVSQIFNGLTESGVSIGYSTVYRQIEKLVESKSVIKYVIDNTSSACFEYIGDESEPDESVYHLKCESCGKIIHLTCNEINEFENHICAHHNFTVDPTKTVFYGICGSCASK